MMKAILVLRAAARLRPAALVRPAVVVALLALTSLSAARSLPTIAAADDLPSCGLSVDAGDGAVLQGNYLGVDATGTTARVSTYGACVNG